MGSYVNLCDVSLIGSYLQLDCLYGFEFELELNGSINSYIIIFSYDNIIVATKVVRLLFGGPGKEFAPIE
jgi:hypothetical protein